MEILTERRTWRRKRNATVRQSYLTDAERQRIKDAIRHLSGEAGSMARLARCLGVSRTALKKAAAPSANNGAPLALRLARFAGVPVEDLLSGVWPYSPSTRRCPCCGATLHPQPPEEPDAPTD